MSSYPGDSVLSSADAEFISDNVKRVIENVSEAAVRAGRRPEDITIVAASKMNGCERVRRAAEAGITVCGENRVQEMLEKNALGAYDGCRLHLIGHLQKNKVKNVVGLAELIQSVDSIALLEAVSRAALVKGIVQDVLLEVNIADEPSKSGFPVSGLSAALDAAETLDGIKVRGLMAIPPVCEKSEENLPYFQKMYKLFVDIGSKKYDNSNMDFLSMGMSNDYMTAIECGSSMVRIGTGIFGPRNYPVVT